MNARDELAASLAAASPGLAELIARDAGPGLDECDRCGRDGESHDWGHPFLRPDVAVPDNTDIAEHLDTCEGCTECAERAWCEWCQADTIPIRGCCHECNQPVGRSTAPDRMGEH